jgi:DNA-binding CsgD family transcriptional regulator/uncharacterized protein YkwD
MPYTDRQGQILELAAQGLSDKEIARRLSLSTHTVRTHLKRLYRDQQLSNRAEAVANWVTEQHEQITDQATAAPATPEVEAKRHKWVLAGHLLHPPTVGSIALALLLISLLGGLLVASRLNLSLAKTFVPGPTSSEAANRPSMGLGQHHTSPAATANGGAPQAMLSPSGLVGPAQSVGPSTGTAVKTQVESAQQGLINRDRASAGLPALGWNDCLAAVALLNAQRMAAQGYVSTTNGVALDRDCKLGSIQPAENLGYWNGINDGAVNSLFMANPVQRANIMGNFHFVGTAWAVGPTGIAFVAVEFS